MPLQVQSRGTEISCSEVATPVCQSQPSRQHAQRQTQQRTRQTQRRTLQQYGQYDFPAAQAQDPQQGQLLPLPHYPHGQGGIDEKSSGKQRYQR